MMRKARLAIRKVNVALDRPGYYFGTGRSLIPSSHLFVSGRISSKRERLAHQGHDHLRQVFRIKQPGRWERTEWDRTMTAMMIEDGNRVATGGAGF